MLQIKDIHKQYKTGDLIQKSLDGVSLRNIFLDLSESGLLIASVGKNGGVHLARAPKKHYIVGHLSDR